MVPLALNLNPSARSCSPTCPGPVVGTGIDTVEQERKGNPIQSIGTDLVETREAVGLVDEATLGEARDEVGEALVVGERRPDGLQRRVHAHPGAHQPPVPLPASLGNLDLEADVVGSGPKVVFPVLDRRFGRGGGSGRGEPPRGRQGEAEASAARGGGGGAAEAAAAGGGAAPGSGGTRHHGSLSSAMCLGWVGWLLVLVGAIWIWKQFG